MAAVHTNGVTNSTSSALTTLPKELALVNPTVEEIEEQIGHNAVSWRGALSVEAYLRRERHLSKEGLSKNAGLTYWVLVDQSAGVHDGKRTVLAGCETLRKRALVSKRGKVSEVVCHGVGSVFTPPARRGKGYGAMMIGKLGRRLQSWQTDDAPVLMSILYSDIGKTFYAKHGWMPFPSSHMHLDSTVSEMNGHGGGLEVKLLHRGDLEKLCAADEAMIRRRMARRTKQSTAVALVPDYKTVEWHHAREEFVSSELYGRSPEVKGAIVQTGEGRVWCIWSRMWYNEDPRETKGNTMHIMRLVIEDENLCDEEADKNETHVAAIAALLRVAQRDAHEWHMEEVELWNPHPRTVLAVRRIDPTAKIIDRDSESITSLKWYGEQGEQVDWLENEKYAWC